MNITSLTPYFEVKETLRYQILLHFSTNKIQFYVKMYSVKAVNDENLAQLIRQEFKCLLVRSLIDYLHVN